MAKPDCWWCVYDDAVPQCGMARQMGDVRWLDCQRRHPKIWSGQVCGVCLAPADARCLDDETVLGCNGFAYTSPSSAAGTDICCVCGGNSTCSGATAAMPMYVDYLFDLTRVPQILHNAAWCEAVAFIAAILREADCTGSQTKTMLEDCLGDSGSEMGSLDNFYRCAKENGRLSEVVFMLNYNKDPLMLQQMIYGVESTLANSHSSPSPVVEVYNSISRTLSTTIQPLAQAHGITVYYTSTLFQPAVARLGSLQSLWFAVKLVFFLVYYVSLMTAVTATMVAAIMCFGSLTVRTIFDWEVEGVLQVCISCTVRIGVQYVVHFCSGYFDYLQTTSSNLFAGKVTLWGAAQGALLRSAPAVCTSAFCVIVVSIMFAVSSLVPLRRAGQVSITLHLLVLFADALFTGAVAAFGPMKAYQHWTTSAAIGMVCAVLAALAVLIMSCVNGELGPHGSMILTR
ncbi:hypothetical protein CUR178_04618 [Leishmania enriettii]|uniref:Uncharacterized protein n=1 Tax=Leishmania enriettii TaxID=5663 RepID=A0A836G4U6_LEIEN|nr:hypothetical protein CUR178_04618 [Leishmania enriettii]